jgi:hypothetical protein
VELTDTDKCLVNGRGKANSDELIISDFATLDSSELISNSEIILLILRLNIISALILGISLI